MKEILAIVRNECVEPSKAALETIGIKGITFISVIGRGRQRGTIRTPDPEGTLRREVGVYILQQRGLIKDADNPKYHLPVEKELELGFLPKRMLILIAGDEEVPAVVRTLVQINKSGQHGDGKIFVCPVADALRISTGERGEQAIS